MKLTRRAILRLAAGAAIAIPFASACAQDSDGQAGTGGGGASNGQQLFVNRCGACHTIQGVQGAVGVAGPNLSNIASAADQRKPGMTVEEYLRESITEPDAYVVQGFQRGAMPKLPLNDQQVNDLVAFLMTRQ